MYFIPYGCPIWGHHYTNCSSNKTRLYAMKSETGISSTFDLQYKANSYLYFIPYGCPIWGHHYKLYHELNSVSAKEVVLVQMHFRPYYSLSKSTFTCTFLWNVIKDMHNNECSAITF